MEQHYRKQQRGACFHFPQRDGVEVSKRYCSLELKPLCLGKISQEIHSRFSCTKSFHWPLFSSQQMIFGQYFCFAVEHPAPPCQLCCSIGCFPFSQAELLGQGVQKQQEVYLSKQGSLMHPVSALHKQCQRWGRSRTLLKAPCVTLKSILKNNPLSTECTQHFWATKEYGLSITNALAFLSKLQYLAVCNPSVNSFTQH